MRPKWLKNDTEGFIALADELAAQAANDAELAGRFQAAARAAREALAMIDPPRMAEHGRPVLRAAADPPR